MLQKHFDRYLSGRYTLSVNEKNGDDIIEGVLTAKMAGRADGVIVGSIPRFVPAHNYCDNFGLQWNRFRSTQLDSFTGISRTEEHFWQTTRWRPDDCAAKTVLEAGCGAGRFTEILIGAGARVVSFDFSNSVEANYKNNASKGDLFLFQGDIFDIPFDDTMFDFVFCHGVLQHTPSPRRAFRAIEAKLRGGGRISIDVYLKDGKIRPWKSKYLWRPLTKRMKRERLLRFLEWFIPKWLPIDTFIKRIRFLGNFLGSVVPCWNYFYTDLKPAEKVQWAIMDTFDALAPEYDNPVRLKDVKQWFAESGYTSADIFLGGNGIVGNGIKSL